MAPPKFEEFAAKYRGQMYVHLAFAAFAASSDRCITWTEFEDLWTWLHPPRSAESPHNEKRTDEDKSTREVFEEIGGVGDELTFEKFVAYAEMHPNFEKRLR